MKTQFELPLAELIHFLRVSCHDNLHLSMSKVKGLLNHDQKAELTSILDKIFEAAALHLGHEEKTFFPLLISQGEQIKNSVIHLVDDHLQLSELLDQLWFATNGFVPLQECEVMIYEELKEMDRILRNHIKLENNVLFPLVMKSSTQRIS